MKVSLVLHIVLLLAVAWLFQWRHASIQSRLKEVKAEAYVLAYESFQYDLQKNHKEYGLKEVRFGTLEIIAPNTTVSHVAFLHRHASHMSRSKKQRRISPCEMCLCSSEMNSDA